MVTALWKPERGLCKEEANPKTLAGLSYLIGNRILKVSHGFWVATDLWKPGRGLFREKTNQLLLIQHALLYGPGITEALHEEIVQSFTEMYKVMSLKYGFTDLSLQGFESSFPEPSIQGTASDWARKPRGRSRNPVFSRAHVLILSRCVPNMY